MLDKDFLFDDEVQGSAFYVTFEYEMDEEPKRLVASDAEMAAIQYAEQYGNLTDGESVVVVVRSGDGVTRYRITAETILDYLVYEEE